MTVLIAVLVYGVWGYCVQQADLTANQIEIPWLLSAYIGLMVTTISYLIMLLGVISLIDSIFVNGFLKMIGILGSLAMGYTIAEEVFAKAYTNGLVQKIYGFLTLKSVAGTYYTKIGSVNNPYLYSWDGGMRWVHDNLNPALKYMGEWIDYEKLDLTLNECWAYFSNLNQLYDFSNLNSYVLYVLGYLLIGFLLFGFVIRLSERQELSKEGFYFGFGRYLYSGMVAVTFYMLVVDWNGVFWYQILGTVASVLVFAVLMCVMNLGNSKVAEQRKKACTKWVHK